MRVNVGKPTLRGEAMKPFPKLIYVNFLIGF